MKQQILETIRSYSDKLMTQHTRQQRLHTLRLCEINNVFNVLWDKKEELLECDAFEPIFEAMNELLKITEEESELLEMGAASVAEATDGMLEALGA